MRTPAHLLTLLSLLFLVACASSQTPASATRQTDVRVADQVNDAAALVMIQTEGSSTAFLLEHPPEQVLRALEEVWQALELPVGVYEPEQRLIGNEGFRATRIAGERMAEWVDCGSGMTGPNANRFDVVVTLFTTASAHEQGTELVIDMDGQGKPRDYSGNWMHCSSKGALEELIAELVSARL